MTKKLDPRSKAIAAQLRAEIAGSDYKKIAPFARALNEKTPTDPTTFFNRVSGKIPMPIEVVFDSLDLLGIYFETFIADAMKRVPRQHD